MMSQNHLPTQFDVVAELGPGNSLGVGLAALLSGVKRFDAFDVVDYTTNQRNLEVFEDLIELFQRKAPIPGPEEFPEAKPFLSSYAFPSHILTEERLHHALKGERLEVLRSSLLSMNGGDARVGGPILYFVPWDGAEVIREATVDLIYAQAVLEHVDDLDRTYGTLARWLKPNGLLSCQIDFKCHETAAEWNGHWAYSDFVWTLIRGRRPYLLNREPHSSHAEFLRRYGFRVVCDFKAKMPSKIQKEDLAPRFKDLSEEDLTTSGAFIQAVKKG